MELPILGQGSQPLDEDGAMLEYLPLPAEMQTYSMPVLPECGFTPELQAAKDLLLQLLSELTHFTLAKAIAPLSLTHLDIKNRQFISELLGEGEVSVLYSGDSCIRIQESVLAGVWRLQKLSAEQTLMDDWLEVGIIPQIISQASFDSAKPCIDTEFDVLPEGVMNAPPLLTELNGQIANYTPGTESYVINLSLLPQTEQDLAFLMQRLGSGVVTILSRGYGNCRITSTGIEHVWWVQYFNSEDALILNTLEVTDVPQVACAAVEDISDSGLRLQDILNVYL